MQKKEYEFHKGEETRDPKAYTNNLFSNHGNIDENHEIHIRVFLIL